MDTFTPAQNPSIAGSSGSQSPRVLTVQFGDGYAQTVPDGLNTSPVMFEAAWANLYNADARNILAFFRAHVAQVFIWQSPGDTAARRWQVKKWTWGFPSAATMSVNASFEEHFDNS